MADRSPLLAPPPPQLAPRGLYITGEDYLRITAWCSLASTQVIVTGRTLRVDGKAIVHRERLAANSDRTSASRDMRVGEGWLTELSAIVVGSAPQRGHVFVRVDLMRGEGAAGEFIATLIQGYVTATARRAWPDSTIDDAVWGDGLLRAVAGTDPGAGVEISQTVPTNTRWRYLAMRYQLVTDGTAANRWAIIVLDDGTNVYFQSEPTAAIVASTTRQFNIGNGTQRQALANADFMLTFPVDLRQPAGHRIRTATLNLQAGDNYAAPQLLVEEWLEATS
ncbi:MAG: hypothetical protein WBC33_07785 [Conexibacter sp.]